MPDDRVFCVYRWFFHDCSRELAEKILTQCHHMGNTLMRVSWTARNTGSYAISKRMEWLAV